MRKWSAYELTQLLRYNIDPDHALQDYPAAMPVEYITGYVQFKDYEFQVNRNTLIPRVETEELVDHALKWIKEQTRPITFADVGTGSGIIGISLLLNAGDQITHGYLLDTSITALAITRLNATQLLSSKSNYTLAKSDLLQTKDKLPQLDLIIANLPYIPTSRIPTLAKSVTDFEPHLALDGGSDGLDLITRLLEQAESMLTPDGIVMLEVDDTHVNAARFTQWKIAIIPDFAGKTRFWLATRK